MMPVRPSIICLTQTWLSPNTARTALVGYSVVVRHDRDDGRNGGGVIIFAIGSLINNVVPIYLSIVAERFGVLSIRILVQFLFALGIVLQQARSDQAQGSVHEWTRHYNIINYLQGSRRTAPKSITQNVVSGNGKHRERLVVPDR